MSLLPGFPGLHSLTLESASDQFNSPSQQLSTNTGYINNNSEDVAAANLDLVMQQQMTEFWKRSRNIDLMDQIQSNQVNNMRQTSSLLGDVENGQNRTEMAITELRHDILEVKMGIFALLQDKVETSHENSVDISPTIETNVNARSNSPPPHRPGGTTTVHIDVTTECCKTKVSIQFEYVPGRVKAGDKYVCFNCKKSFGKNYYQRHAQDVCLRKNGCPNCQAS